MKPMAILSLFRRVDLLKSLGDDELQGVVAKCAISRYARGKQILSALDDTSDVFFILDGRVQVKNYSRSGRELTYSEIGEGELFGEFAAIDGLPRAAAILAMQDTIAARLTCCRIQVTACFLAEFSAASSPLTGVWLPASCSGAAPW